MRRVLAEWDVREQPCSGLDGPLSGEAACWAAVGRAKTWGQNVPNSKYRDWDARSSSEE